jgi:hypothetical protein
MPHTIYHLLSKLKEEKLLTQGLREVALSSIRHGGHPLRNLTDSTLRRVLDSLVDQELLSNAILNVVAAFMGQCGICKLDDDWRFLLVVPASNLYEAALYSGRDDLIAIVGDYDEVRMPYMSLRDVPFKVSMESFHVADVPYSTVARELSIWGRLFSEE